MPERGGWFRGLFGRRLAPDRATRTASEDAVTRSKRLADWVVTQPRETKWCRELSVKIIKHYLDNGIAWKKLSRALENRNGDRERLDKEAWRVMSLHVDPQFESGIPSPEEIAKEMNIPVNDVRDLFKLGLQNTDHTL